MADVRDFLVVAPWDDNLALGSGFWGYVAALAGHVGHGLGNLATALAGYETALHYLVCACALVIVVAHEGTHVGPAWRYSLWPRGAMALDALLPCFDGARAQLSAEHTRLQQRKRCVCTQLLL